MYYLCASMVDENRSPTSALFLPFWYLGSGASIPSTAKASPGTEWAGIGTRGDGVELDESSFTRLESQRFNRRSTYYSCFTELADVQHRQQSNYDNHEHEFPRNRGYSRATWYTPPLTIYFWGLFLFLFSRKLMIKNLLWYKFFIYFFIGWSFVQSY